MKRIFKITLSVALTLLLCLPYANIFAENSTQSTLSFNENGNFRILIIADPQDVLNPRPETIDLMNAALENTKPDLVVFTGDNIHGPGGKIAHSEKKTLKAIEQIMEPVTSREIPFCVVFGNHDDEGGISKETQMELYRSMPNCLAVCGEDMTGCGNYNLTIKASGSDQNVFNLWFIDSGTYNKDENIDSYYAFVADDQIEWYKNKSDELKEENGGTPMPSILFQHMPVTEIFDLLKEVPKGTDGAVEKHGKYYILNEEIAEGYLGEGPCPPDYNNGEFSAWKEQGDILGAFFGHDHVNDFKGTLDGIEMIHTPGAGFFIYGNGPEHGVRVIDISEEELNYTTKTLYYKDLVGDTLHGGKHLWYMGQSTFNNIVKTVICVIMALTVITAVSVSVIKKILKKKRRK